MPANCAIVGKMRIFSAILLLVLAGIVSAMTICRPDWLGENGFLKNFVNHEYLSALIVIVTVSYVSVAQIHLEYTRIERTFRMRVFGDARREVNAGAVALVVLLLISIPLVVLKAGLEGNVFAQSFIHGLSLLILVASTLIMFDFVRAVYIIAAEEPINNEEDDDNEGRPGGQG